MSECNNLIYTYEVADPLEFRRYAAEGRQSDYQRKGVNYCWTISKAESPLSFFGDEVPTEAISDKS